MTTDARVDTPIGSDDQGLLARVGRCCEPGSWARGRAWLVQAGRLKALGVTARNRSPLVPDLPGMLEAGLPDYEMSFWYGIFVPARTPPEVVNVLNRKVNELLATPEMRAAIHAQGAEPLPMTPAQFSNVVKDDYLKWKGIVAASGATIE